MTFPCCCVVAADLVWRLRIRTASLQKVRLAWEQLFRSNERRPNASPDGACSPSFHSVVVSVINISPIVAFIIRIIVIRISTTVVIIRIIIAINVIKVSIKVSIAYLVQ